MAWGPLFLTEKQPKTILTNCLWSCTCFTMDDQMLPGAEGKDPGNRSSTHAHVQVVMSPVGKHAWSAPPLSTNQHVTPVL